MLQNGKLQYYTHCSQLNTQLYIEFLQNGSKCEVKYVGGDNVAYGRIRQTGKRDLFIKVDLEYVVLSVGRRNGCPRFHNEY